MGDPLNENYNYTTKKLNRDLSGTVIRLVAQDLPGNQATLEQILK